MERCSVLQEFLQQGVPVVSRFLAEYLVTWDGKELLVNVLSLIAVMQITEFEGTSIMTLITTSLRHLRTDHLPGFC